MGWFGLVLGWFWADLGWFGLVLGWFGLGCAGFCADAAMAEIHTRPVRDALSMYEWMNILPRAMSRILPGPGPDKAGQGDKVRQGDVGIKRLLDIPTKQRCQAFKIRSRTNQ